MTQPEHGLSHGPIRGPHHVGELLHAQHGPGLRLGELRGTHVIFTPDAVTVSAEIRVRLDWDELIDVDLCADLSRFRTPPGFQLICGAAFGSVGWSFEPATRAATVTLILAEDVLRLPLERTPGRGYRASDVRAIETYLRLCVRSEPARAALADPGHALALVRTISHRGGGELRG